MFSIFQALVGVFFYLLFSRSLSKYFKKHNYIENQNSIQHGKYFKANETRSDNLENKSEY